MDFGVHQVHPAVFRAADVPTAETHRMELEIATHGRVVATNHLDLTIYPRRERPPTAAVLWSAEPELRDRLRVLGYTLAETIERADAVLATSVDAELCTGIRQGGSAILLLDRPGELQPLFPHWQGLRVVPRCGSVWQGDWASSFSWLRRQGPFARLPGGPLLDHGFDRVIPRHVIAGCSALDFQARVHAGMVVGWVHKPVALILERNYGCGRMLATTFRLLEDPAGGDPTATALLDGLIEIAVSTREPVPSDRIDASATLPA
jgi:hypothetical protein